MNNPNLELYLMGLKEGKKKATPRIKNYSNIWVIYVTHNPELSVWDQTNCVFGSRKKARDYVKKYLKFFSHKPKIVHYVLSGRE